MSENCACWCDNKQCVTFSPDYLRCPKCETLVWVGKDDASLGREKLLDTSYYGQEYWFNHQTDELGLEDIQIRSRLDLSERCLYWLKVILKYKLPPAKVLELGSAHGAFVAILQKAGFEATGLEIDPWIVNFARQTFQISMLEGPIETQEIQPTSIDMIVLMDVLEHLPDPMGTMKRCLELLKPEGILVLQTPMYPEVMSYNDLLNDKHAFLRMLIPKEHIHLFSKKGIDELCDRLQLSTSIFEPAFFEGQDMMLIASRIPLTPIDPAEIEKHLLGSAEGRFVLALLDLNEQITKIKDTLETVEADRAARLELINRLDEIIRKQNRILNWLPQNIVRRVLQRFVSRSDKQDEK